MGSGLALTDGFKRIVKGYSCPWHFLIVEFQKVGKGVLPCLKPAVSTLLDL